MLSEAALMMSQVNATMRYTDAEVSPLLARSMRIQFIPQAVPFFAAQRTFNAIAADRPDYTYRQPADNPTNPADRLAPWESDIIRSLRAQPALRSLVTERHTAAGSILSLSQPVRVTTGCLVCHSTPQAAPASMIDAYGSANGFGWADGSTVGAQIVSVPERVPLARARVSLLHTMAALAGVFLVMLVLLNILLHLLIVRPVRRISRTADRVSLGDLDVPEFERMSDDEIGSLALSFNRMRRSLVAAFRLLEG